ncbi:MAG: IS66 family insertion sequence element accessory protein TnpB [Geoalkalibacter sp.]|mgnify:CR=1 FL=1|jgi:hypothetical protein|uniref:IS66 family insertion sequence element accessory protein TnpB n=1 Tax=Geoalkalibacter sp. TaxID=3041440 RepID=UPI003D0D47E7
MISVDRGVRVFLAPGATDMRKSIDTLAILVAGLLDQDPLSGHLFGFCNRRRDTIKMQIPDDPDHGFHLIPATDSTRSRPVIPEESGQA